MRTGGGAPQPSRAPAFSLAVPAAGALIAAAIATVNPIFGVLDNTADELADLLKIDEAPAAAVAAVRALRPAYAPLKAVSTSCTAAVFPEFNDMLDMNDCLLLPSRVFWSKGGRLPITIRQTMTTGEMWKVSTGSTVWGGGVVLQRYIESLGTDFWEGKRVIELGTGTGLGGISAARLGASVLATDRDGEVLQLAETNARANGAGERFGTSLLEWGPAPTDGSASEPAYAQPWDVVIGADLTYNREAWPLLVETLQRLQAPAILSASERRPNELQSLKDFFISAGLRYTVVASPMTDGYAASNIVIFRIDKPPPPRPAPASAPAASSASTPGPAALGGGGGGAGGSSADAVRSAKDIAKERAGVLLRYTFNDKDGTLWYEVDPELKQQRIDWAYASVNAKAFDEKNPPRPPPELLRQAAAPAEK